MLKAWRRGLVSVLQGRLRQYTNVITGFSADSYIGMDQQQDMKLDVKEAAAVPADHPQWDLSESDTDNNDQVTTVTYTW